MDWSRTRERLETYQQRILELTEKAERLMGGPPAEACPALARLRWETMRVMREYQLFKHSDIFDPVIASAARRPAGIATDMKARCIAVGETYAAFVTRWGAADMAGEWEEYRSAMRAMSGSVRAHLADERLGVRALLGKAA